MMTRKHILRAVLKSVVPVLGYALMRILWYTSKKHFHIEDEFDDRQYLYVCWHGELLMSPQAYRYLHKTQKASAMISHHFDGELIAKIYAKLGISSIRGSSRNGAKEVLLKAFRQIKEGTEILLTPDGPRGPRYHMHDGAVGIAFKSKCPVCVITFTCNRYWQLDSWDRFVIPKPFSTINFYVSPLYLNDMTFEDAKIHLRNKMLENTIV